MRPACRNHGRCMQPSSDMLQMMHTDTINNDDPHAQDP